MKRLLLTILALVAMTAGVQTVWAAEPYAVYTSDNTTLTFYYDNLRESRTGSTFDMNINDAYPGWRGYRPNVTRVIFDASFANARPTSTYYWFHQMKNLQSITGLSYLNTSEVTLMTCMFYGCEKLGSLDVSHFNTTKVTDMRSMFDSCKDLTSLDVSSFNTANVTNMSSMFSNCYNLTSLDLTNFNTTNVTTMAYMFSQCTRLISANVSSFNTSNVTDMNRMFTTCFKLESLDLSNFYTPKVTDMQEMFYSCRILKSLDLGRFNTAKVTNMASMFGDCGKLTTIYVGKGWSTEAVTQSSSMFWVCNNLVGGAGTTFDSNHTDAAYAHIDGGPSNPGYFTEKEPKRGDANLDGTVDIADVVAVLNAMANDSNAPQFNVNGDAAVDIADVVAVLNIMAQQ